MPTTARELITKAFYLSGITARGLQEVSSEQLNDGLDMLNEILDITCNNQGLIPYETKVEIPAVIGQELYFIPNMSTISSVTFFIQSVRYPLMRATHQQYWAYARVNDINSLPFQYYCQYVNGGMNLYLYFFPQQEYPLEIWGKTQFVDVGLNDNLGISMDGYYIAYLRYKLAEYICEYYDEVFSLQKSKKLASYEQSLRNKTPQDFTLNKLSAFQKGSSPDYAQRSLGHGWTVY